MASIFRLDQPCPCGSADTHADCCAPGKRRFWRRMSEKFGAQKARRKDNSRRKELPVPLGKPDMLDLMKFVERFSEPFSDAFNTGSAWQREAFGEYMTAQVLDHLEIAPDKRLFLAQSMLLRSYGVFRSHRPYGEDAAAELARRVAEKHGEASAEIFEVMQDARLGAWRVAESDDGFAATRVDGTDAPLRRELDLFTDHQWAAITSPGVYVGWLIERDDTCMLFFAAKLNARAVEVLNRAAERAPWGWPEGSGDDAFRSAHYEEDILSLLVRADCINTGRDDMRVLLSSSLRRVWYLRHANLFDDVAQALEMHGLRSPVYLDDANVVRTHGAAKPDLYHCHFCKRLHRKNIDKIPGWSIDVALLVDDHLDAIVNQLEAMRADAVPKSTAWHYTIPVGPHSLEYVLPVDEMLAMIALDPSGRIAHPRLARAEEYPLATLAIDADAFRKAGFDLNWSIGQARSWAKRHAPNELGDMLEKAVERYHAALRWACLVDRHRQLAFEATTRLAYDQIYWGIRKLLPAEALETPVSEIDDPSRGTWNRIERAMREQQGFDAPLLRIGHLPACAWELNRLRGVGHASISTVADALKDFVARWPESMGYSPISTSAEAQEAASGELASGLDELDALF